ncbi:uncharacterized protein LOC127285810 [Leptopilina boulardi]|uniref:uncharacterized protein LOC127285810 n=1 Tax=Leptopilina boulardi TaxID=63433 RepID=UPI0021F5971B|nr:uncharacterized protein LOC127285810 [Leptopilina boulardi]
MRKLIVTTFLLVLAVNLTTASTNNLSSDLKKLNKIFFNPSTGSYITGKLTKLENSTNSLLKQYSFQGASCNCVKLDCNCCIKLNAGLIIKNKTMCNQIGFLPEEFAVTIKVLVDGKTKLNTTISASNPPAACIPVPNIPVLDVCIRLRDLQIHNSTFHSCLDVQAKMTNVLILTLQFDCFNISSKGIESSNVNKIITLVDKEKKIFKIIKN